MIYLFRKMRRDLVKLFPQFIAVFLMAFIGVLLYTGVEGTWYGMSQSLDKYFDSTNLPDAWVYTKNVTQEELKQIKAIKGIQDIDKSMILPAQLNTEEDRKISDIPDLKVMTMNSESMTKFQVIQGKGFEEDTGIWLDSDFAKAHNLKVNDTLSLKINQLTIKFKISGLILHPEYVYYTTSNDEVMPNHFNHGYCVVSESYINKLLGGIVYNKITLKLDKNIDENSLKQSIQDVLKKNYLGYVNQENFQPVKAPKNKIAQVRMISIMFSSVFLLLALLTIQTTMRRLVENQRSQIGTLKALGFHDATIMLHYSLYGLIVTLMGSVLGLILGPYLLSPILLAAQSKSYSIPDLKSEIMVVSYIVVCVVTISCTFATVLATRKGLKGMPAETMRGSAPKSGKKILLEGLPKIWRSMSFDWKWSFRDIARNKIRTIMGMIGVIGCMVLIIASLGLQDSANSANSYLYGTEYTYDKKVSLSSNDQSDALNDLSDEVAVQFVQENNVELFFNDNKKMGVISVVDKGSYVNIENTNGEFVKLPSEGVLLSHKMAAKLGVHKGDEIEFNHNEQKYNIKVTVVDIAKIPSPQGIIASRDSWTKLGFSFTPTAILTNEEMEPEILSKLDENTKSISRDSQLASVEELMDSFKMIFAMLIAAAVLLGVVILYNLGLLSYTERLREYATLRVLGFYQKEITLFALRESMLTTIVGWIIAIPISFMFLKFYVSVVSVDAFEWFSALKPMSFIIATVITIGCSISVSFILSQKVKKINMIEALKSVE
ncbi:ABC transporter permease [Ruminiclostridium josui]|uniref:ABC transporter permease n=2 Tax=Ruminiclostridium josui TaxID=1499 RepID=UPI0004B1845C|nr:ABC transporter permease [Ruminiclostridium josui]